jgi:pyruvate/2-oxoglutarate dehydrogenase complex dihydrolipoamide dehydrogenase (E3) component
MSAIDRYDLAVVGSGEAGKYLAWTLSKAGHRAALVERGMVGGSCPNVACLPSKNIIHSAKVASLAQRGTEFGLEIDSMSTNMAGVQRRKRTMVDALVKVHLDRYEASGVDLIMGQGRLLARNTIAISLNAGGERVITADRVVLSLGTRATYPDLPGLVTASPLTHVEALDLERVPAHLVVIGGGYVGLELAQAIRRFGSRVTVIQRGPQLASREDSDVGAALLDLFRNEGIQVLLNATVSGVEGRSGEQVRVNVEDAEGARAIEASDLLIAAGRTPNTQGIGLAEAGIELDRRGYIVVNERLETTAAGVWAVGDCAGSPHFTHAAYDDFRIVRDNLTGGHRTTHERLVPFCMFTDPELARVGLNEREARRQGVSYRLAQLPMAAVLRTRTLSEPRGFVKMLIDDASDRILGFSAFGAEASELMATVQTAMLGHLPFTVLRDALFTHPTAAEGLTVLLADVASREENRTTRRAMGRGPT